MGYELHPTPASIGAAPTPHLLGGVDHTADTQAALESKISTLGGANLEITSHKGAASGYASLDAGVKVPYAQIPVGAGVNTICAGDDTRLIAAGSVQGSHPVWLPGSAYTDSYRTWALGTTDAICRLLGNITAAGNGAQQISPSDVLSGKGWGTGGSGSTEVQSWVNLLPVQGVTAVGTRQWKFKIGAGALSATMMALTSTGLLTDTLGYWSTSGYDAGIGVGAVTPFGTTFDGILASINSGRADGGGNVVFANVYDRNAASITNAATMVHTSFAWVNNADAYAMLAGVYCDGRVWTGKSFEVSNAFAFGATTTIVNQIENTSPAINGTQQSSGAQCFAGRGWQTSDSSSQRIACYVDVLPVQGVTPTGTMQWKWKIGGAALGAEVMTLTSGHVLTVSYLSVYGGWVYITGAYFQATTTGGLGTTYGITASGDGIVALISPTRTDGANNIVVASCYNKGAAITNAATMRLHQFSVTLAAGVNTELASVRCNGDLFVCQGVNAQTLQVQHLTELLTIGAGVSTASTIAFPANCIRLASSVRVTTVIPVAATFIVTSTVDATAHTGAISTAANTTDKGTLNMPKVNTTASTITITPNTPPLAATGVVRVDLYFIDLTVAGS